MKLYLIESGFCSQSGKIIGIYQDVKNAYEEIDRIRKNEEQKADTVVTLGKDEYDDDPRVLFGFWSGPERGNRTAHGWRVREVATAD